MRPETIVIHSGFESDPATYAVAVPIYQTAAYVFDSADHAAALFNLEEEGFRYSRISNPTVAGPEKRVADLLACHPASTTHRQMAEVEQHLAGVTPEAIYLSIGVEHKDDIIADIDQALAACKCGQILQAAE